MINKSSSPSSRCSECHTRLKTEWRELSRSQLQYIDQLKISNNYRPGDFLYHQGDDCKGIFCIKTGLVGEQRVDANGKVSIVRLNYEGTTLGYRELLTGASYRNSAQVLNEGLVCFIEKSAVSELLAKDPLLGERFIKKTIEQLNAMEDNLCASFGLNVRQRLLHMLLTFYERHGRFKKGSGYTVKIPIKKREVGDLIGVGPVTISRTIKKLQEENLVIFKGRTAYFSSLKKIYDNIAYSGFRTIFYLIITFP